MRRARPLLLASLLLAGATGSAEPGAVAASPDAEAAPAEGPAAETIPGAAPAAEAKAADEPGSMLHKATRALSRGGKSRGVVLDDTRAWPRHLTPLEGRRPQASAVSIAPGGGGAAGIAWGYADVERAGAEALARCREMREKAAPGAECALYALGDRVVFDFAGLREPGAPLGAEACLAHPEVAFYRLNAWIRVFRVADLSFAGRVEAEFALELGLDGSVREARWLGGEAAQEAPSREAILQAAPFGPLFGPLRCLASWPVHFPLEDPRTAEARTIEAPL